MDKKIIAVCGRKNTGKTIIIKHVVEKIEKDTCFKELRPDKELNSFYNGVKIIIEGSNDVFKIFEKGNNKGNIRIGFISQGDYRLNWIIILILIIIFGCDVIVCATRSKDNGEALEQSFVEKEVGNLGFKIEKIETKKRIKKGKKLQEAGCLSEKIFNMLKEIKQ